MTPDAAPGGGSAAGSRPGVPVDASAGGVVSVAAPVDASSGGVTSGAAPVDAAAVGGTPGAVPVVVDRPGAGRTIGTAHGSGGVPSHAAPVREAGATPVDLRLALPAGVAWLSASVAVRLHLAAVAGLAASAAVVASALLAAALLAARAAPGGPDGASRRHQPPAPAYRGAGRRPRTTTARRRPWVVRTTAAAALGLAVAAAVLGSGAAQRSATAHGLLPQAARDGATVRLVATVTGDPRVQPPQWPGAPARVTVVVGAERVTSRGRTSRAVGQVLVVGAADWGRVPYRARVEVTGRVSADALRGRTVAVLTTTAAPVVVERPPVWARASSAVRSDVRELAGRQPGDAGALLAAIVVGDTSRVPTDLTAALRASGLTHVTAVSGAHFSLVVALVLALATAARAPRWARAAAALVATAGTVALVHPDPSVQRAAAMGLVAVLGLVAGRRGQAPAALATGVVALLVVDPWLGGEIGFLLSVLATGGLVLAGRPLADRWAARLGRPPAEALALPVAAQLCCAPVLLVLAPSVATYAVPANVLAAPAVGPATVLGLLAGLVDPVCAPLARALAACAGAACWWVGAVARLTSALPGARTDWLEGRAGVLTLVLAAAATMTLLLHRRPGRRN